MTTLPSGYGLPSSEAERERLRWQANRTADETEALLVAAGITEGSRVLDAGTGLGDVAFVARRLVGPSGYVLGVDSDPAQVEQARRRATDQSIDNVEFAIEHLDRLPPPARPFDAVVGRFVLMWQTDPTATVRHLTAQLRGGGVVAFMEGSWPLQLSDVEQSWNAWPQHPTVDRIRQLNMRTLKAGGVQSMMGHRLLECFLDAGLEAPQLAVARPLVSVGEEAVTALFRIARSLVPRAAEIGLTGEAGLDLDSMESNLRQWEHLDRFVLGPAATAWTAWARKPAQV